jgi:hypothetical protein
VAGALAVGYVQDRGWVRVTTVPELQQNHLVFIADLRLFVVLDGTRPVALSARSPHLGEAVAFCGMGNVFEDLHGSIFDSAGTYLAGPSPRGMDRVRVRVKGDGVDVKPGELTRGSSRGAVKPKPVGGAFCQPDGPVDPPGFYVMPPPGTGSGGGIPVPAP